MKLRRIEEEEAYIHKFHKVTINELQEKFEVSGNTIRRDVSELVKRGNVLKSHGMVSSKLNNYDVGQLPFYKRSSVMIEEKKKIAEKASEFIENGDCIFIDSGSSVTHLIDYIKDLELTVFTNNVDFIIKAIQYRNIDIITFSGILNRDYCSFTSIDEQSADTLSKYNFTKSFMSATGITVQYGVMNSLVSDNYIKVQAVERAQQVYLLADHTKFGKITMKSYAQLKDIDVIITDREPPEDIVQNIEELGNKIIIV